MYSDFFKSREKPDDSLMNEIKSKYKKVADDLKVPVFFKSEKKLYIHGFSLIMK